MPMYVGRSWGSRRAPEGPSQEAAARPSRGTRAVRENILVAESGAEGVPAADLVPAHGRVRKLVDATVTKKKTKVPAVVLVKRKGMKEAWCYALHPLTPARGLWRVETPFISIVYPGCERPDQPKNHEASVVSFRSATTVASSNDS